jgi:lipopolysaccharide/colanic/teichoic acid biosynthesis glycosyltransferase
MLRRLVDIAVSSALLVLLSPVMLLAALAIRLDSKGRAMFCQTRAGKDGVPFTIYKLRSMRAEAGSDAVTPAGRRDPRITRVGAFFRDSKIDELPQLLNVLKGDMTLIGPRAETPNFVAHYTQRQREVLKTKPGLTGPGQIHYTTMQAASLAAAADAERFYIERILPEKLEQDLEYMRSRSLRVDLSILLRTCAVALTLGRRG